MLKLVLQRQFLVFVAGGVLSALIDIGLMQFLLLTGSAALGAASAGFAAGLLVNYAFHARITFRQLSTPATLARYLCVVAINYGITLLLVAAAAALGSMPLLGKILSLPVVAVNGFFLSKYWIFR
jgi:putative flippase GtrA